MNTNGPSYAVNPGTGPSTRTLADDGAVKEAARYYCACCRECLQAWGADGNRVYGWVSSSPTWMKCGCDESVLIQQRHTRLRATTREQAIAEVQAKAAIRAKLDGLLADRDAATHINQYTHSMLCRVLDV